MRTVQTLPLLAALAALAPPAPAHGADLKIGGDRSAAYLLRLRAEGVAEGAGVLWDVSPEPPAVADTAEDALQFAGPPRAYTVRLTEVRFDGKRIRTRRVTDTFTLTAGTPGPTPPGPTPPEPPKPDPVPDPVAPSRLFVVVVEETSEAVAGRGAFFADPALAARFRERGHRWRVVDKDVLGPDGQPPADVKRFLDQAKGKPYPTLFLVDDKGRTRFTAPVPATPAALLDLITKHGG